MHPFEEILALSLSLHIEPFTAKNIQIFSLHSNDTPLTSLAVASFDVAGVMFIVAP